MRFLLVGYGTRGDIEPCIVVGRELQHRGHEVCLGVAPEQVDFVRSFGLDAMEYEIEVGAPVEAVRTFFHTLFRRFWHVSRLIKLWRDVYAPVRDAWQQAGGALVSLTEATDAVLSAGGYPEVVANVAERYEIPLVSLHFFPLRPNSHLFTGVPGPVTRLLMEMNDWVYWLVTFRLEGEQRRRLGLGRAWKPLSKRAVQRAALELQGYDEILFPEVAEEWKRIQRNRPFVGAITLEATWVDDQETVEWAASGTPPVFFGFGSMAIADPGSTLSLISEACAELGERALVCAGWSDFGGIESPQHVRVVERVNYSTVFPHCRALVHHGGVGTTAMGIRAGVPALILWTLPEQSYFGAQVTRIGIGYARSFARTNRKTLSRDLTRVFQPDCVERAREVASRVKTSSESATRAADLVERFARLGKGALPDWECVGGCGAAVVSRGMWAGLRV